MDRAHLIFLAKSVQTTLRGGDTGFPVTRSCSSVFGNQSSPWFPAAAPFRALQFPCLCSRSQVLRDSGQPLGPSLFVLTKHLFAFILTLRPEMARELLLRQGVILVICLPGKQLLFPIDSMCLHAQSIYKDKE